MGTTFFLNFSFHFLINMEYHATVRDMSNDGRDGEQRTTELSQDSCDLEEQSEWKYKYGMTSEQTLMQKCATIVKCRDKSQTSNLVNEHLRLPSTSKKLRHECSVIHLTLIPEIANLDRASFKRNPHIPLRHMLIRYVMC